jgi:hypothetical protein
MIVVGPIRGVAEVTHIKTNTVSIIILSMLLHIRICICSVQLSSELPWVVRMLIPPIL